MSAEVAARYIECDLILGAVYQSVDPIEEALARASMEQPQQADAHGGTDTNPSSFKSSRTNVGQLKVPGHQLADDSDEHKGMQNADIPIKVVEADTSTSLSGTHSGAPILWCNLHQKIELLLV